jgi:hypothetical protein
MTEDAARTLGVLKLIMWIAFGVASAATITEFVLAVRGASWGTFVKCLIGLVLLAGFMFIVTISKPRH